MKGDHEVPDLSDFKGKGNSKSEADPAISDKCADNEEIESGKENVDDDSKA